MPQNDMRDMGRDLALSDPFMQIGSAIAKVGEAVQSGDVPQSVLDAYDFLKSHVTSGGKAVQDAVKTITDHLSAAPASIKTQVGPYSVEHVTTARPKAQEAAPIRVKADEIQPIRVSADEIQPATTDAAPGSGLGTMQTALQGIKDFGIGAAKGAAHTAIDLGSAVHMIPGVSTVVDKLYGTPGLSAQAFPQARQETAYSNPTQQLGGAAETVAEMAIPVDAGVQAIPSTARAGAKFAEVMGSARNMPVNTIPAVQSAVRVRELAEHGTQMPQVVTKFLKYVTNPDKPEMTYEVARDFLTNLGSLSVSERLALNKPLQRQIAIMTGDFAKSVAETAGKAGKGQLYAQAMKEYARAKQLENVYDLFLRGAQKGALPAAIAGGSAGAGYWLASKVKSILGED